MNFKIDVYEVNEILDILKKLYYMSNTYLNNIVGTYVEQNKLKVLDKKIIINDEITGEIQAVHLQTAISIYLAGNDKNIKELQLIVNKGTNYVMNYISINIKPENYNISKKYLEDIFEENLCEEVIVYFCAFSI